MAIQSIRIKNFMAFGCRNESAVKDNMDGAFQLSFSKGINVIIGENGTGKTSVLKMIYTSIQKSNHEGQRTAHFDEYFLKNAALSDFSNNSTQFSGIEIVIDGERISFVLSGKGILPTYNSCKQKTQTVFVPTTEMLSHSKGFLALNQKYQIPFDQTQVDIIVNASLPEAREVPSYMITVLEKISTVIDGEVIQEDDEFYVLKKDGRKLRFSLEAEGLRKLGLLWKLIRNGLLEPGTVLLWDEPEANLNPELFPLVVEILLELQKNGIQIFLATHSYNFAKYLEIRRVEKEQVQFHNLYHSEQPGVIEASSAYRMEDLHPNHIMMADNKLLDEIYDL